MSNKLSSQAIRLLVSNIFFRAGNSIRRIFLNVYIFKFIGDLKILAIFSIVMLSSHFVWFFISSYIVKRGYRNALSIISLLWTASIFMLFAFDISIIKNYYLILPLFLWCFSWIYWCVYSNNQFDLTVPKNRGNYEWWKKTFRTVNALVTPVLIGAVISQNMFWNGYSVAFLLGWIMFLLSALLSFVDESKLKIQDTTFKLREILILVSKRREIISILIIILLIGFALSTNVIEVLTPLVLTDNGVNELWIGAFISIVSLASILASYIFGKYVDYKYYKASFIVAWCIYLVLIGLLLVLPTQLHFTIFITSLALLYIFMDIPVTVYASNYLHEIPNYKNLTSEYILMREFATIAWRMLMFVPMLFIASFSLVSLFFIFFSMAFSIFLSMILFIQLPIPKSD